MKIKIVPLSKSNLDETTKMVLHSYDTAESDFDYIPRWLNASLAPEKNKELYKEFKCTWLKYWVGVEEETNKVVGMIGLYTTKEDEKDAYWVGWFVVDKDKRRQGIGKQLMSLDIEKTKKDGKNYLRLYTSGDDAERAANLMYDKLGFVEMKNELYGKKHRLGKINYKEFKISNKS